MIDATVTFRRQLLTNALTRPALRKTKANYMLRQVRGIVAHWTANLAKGADAAANVRYFQNGCPGPGGSTRAASAHYVVDDRTVIQCLPDIEVGFHVGDKPRGKRTPTGTKIMEGFRGLTPNYFLIGFEMCVNAGSMWEFTYQHSAALAAELLVKYQLQAHRHLYRHYDITGKLCPQMMIDDHAWNTFRLCVAQHQEVLERIAWPAVVSSPDGELNVRSGPGSKYALLYPMLNTERVLVYELREGWALIGPDRWVSANYLQPAPTFLPAV